MNADQLSHAWGLLDREHLAALARSGPRPIFATVSGAHLYGFASPDSDVDLRGAYLLSAHELLRMRPASETLSFAEDTPVEIDWVAHDLRKFARLMTNHNGYVLEQLFSPLVVVTSDEHAELCTLGQGCVTRPTVRHYMGFFNGRRERLRQPRPTVKHLLYAYRVVLSGIHLMESGQVVAHLEVLNERFEVPTIETLIARKRHGAEKMLLSEGELAEHEVRLDQLGLQLEEAHAASRLPEEPTSVAALDDFVVRIRLRAAQQAGAP